MIEHFSTLHFSVKCGSVSATARQQTYMYCANNLKQGGGEVPASSVLRTAKLWGVSRNCWSNTRETLETDPRLMDKPAEKLP